MPIAKVFVDESIYSQCESKLMDALPSIRDMLCAELVVPVEACQLNIVPVAGLQDQPLANVEIKILAAPDRTPEKVRGVCNRLRYMVAGITGVRTAVRASMLDPKAYIALK